MREANEERKRQIDLQKAQYELERMQNQRTILQYSEEKGMHYVQDTSGIRDAKQAVDDAQLEIDIAKKEKEISLIEDEIELLEKQKDAIQDQIDALDKQAESIEKYYDKLIKEQEKMFDSMIKNLENQKSKWEELAEIQEIAEAYAAVKQAADDLGYSVEDLLNGNEAAFEDFKSRYIAIMSDCGQNTAFQDGLEYASGVAKEKFGTIISDAQSSVDQLNQTFSNGTFAEAIAQGVSDGIVSAQQELDKMNQLGQDAGDGFVAGWNEKSTEIEEATKQTAIDAVDAFAEGQDSHSPSEKYKSLANDAIDGLLLGVEEKKQEFIDTIKSLAEEGVLAFEEGFNFEDSELKNSFDSLKLLVESVAEAMGIGTEDSVGGLLGALQQLSQFSLGETEDAEGAGIISQFNALKEAVDNVTSSISGGSTGENSNGENAFGSKSSSASTGAVEGGEGNLVSAIEKMGETATETLGEGSEEEGSDGEGAGVIGKFAQLKTAVDAVTTAIGTGEDEEGSGEEGAINLIGALQAHYEKAEETLPEVKTLFEDLLVSIEACATALNTMVSAMTSMSGLSISGGISLPIHAEGTVGKAFAKGYPGLKSREKNALRSEFGQPELTVYPDGTTELTTEPTMSDLPKDTIIFNEEQTRRIMNNSGTTVGKAYANGTVVTSNGTVLRPLQPGDKDYELLKKFEAYHEQFKTQIIPPVNAINKNTELITKSINNVNNRSTQQQISFSTGDIIVQGVQNVDGFAKAVKTHFPNAMLQAIHKR